ncbi:MAG TPA: bifunctional phosphoribosylaminoimidazolecarboxamide formyltransferase/IMP cyclohydrolase [Acidimicrobiales bacterium]|nr:bifunctional phosphoribosylaminoimidazolecarboxamide formyltransferase/IMP cyclohydrolase [Acidimicrobiales bacterium]
MRALLSVFDKTGLEAFASGLASLGVELVASGGTSAVLAAAGIAHLKVEDVTGAPEMLSGRVKTLHPAIHAGILADLDNPAHRRDLAAQHVEPIGLVVCNLYPFRAEPSVEMIDIGGPTMVRAAAKNHAHVAVVVDPADYGTVLDELRREGEIAPARRRSLARAAFAHVAAYDAAIVSWLDEGALAPGELPPTVHLALERAQDLRYGENPHQQGARYRVIGGPAGWWDSAVQHGGRELSYLNVFDSDAAWRLVHEVADLGGTPAAVIVKHANPCGAAIGADLATAYDLAFTSDPLSAFGGIVALSEPVGDALAAAIVANPVADVLVAPAYSPGALSLFAERRKNMRALQAAPPGPPQLGFRQVDGGALVQEPDRLLARPDSWRVVTKLEPTPQQWGDLELAWLVCARTLSNAIVLAAGGQVVGVGCGQQSRVDAAGLAARKADGRAAGGAGASDAFFPFRDGLDAMADAGVGAIAQPGGSLRDDEIVAAADERGIAMVLTGERHFRH